MLALPVGVGRPQFQVGVTPAVRITQELATGAERGRKFCRELLPLHTMCLCTRDVVPPSLSQRLGPLASLCFRTHPGCPREILAGGTKFLLDPFPSPADCYFYKLQYLKRDRLPQNGNTAPLSEPPLLDQAKGGASSPASCVSQEHTRLQESCFQVPSRAPGIWRLSTLTSIYAHKHILSHTHTPVMVLSFSHTRDANTFRDLRASLSGCWVPFLTQSQV